jgi:hypothetical protein
MTQRGSALVFGISDSRDELRLACHYGGAKQFVSVIFEVLLAISTNT